MDKHAEIEINLWLALQSGVAVINPKQIRFALVARKCGVQWPFEEDGHGQGRRSVVCHYLRQAWLYKHVTTVVYSLSISFL